MRGVFMKIRKQEYGNCNMVGKNIERIRKEKGIKQKDFISKFETRPCWGKRHSILTDLSPIASFIAYNNNNNANLKESIRFSNQLAELKDKYNYL